MQKGEPASSGFPRDFEQLIGTAYTYDAEGMRRTKTVGGVTHYYTYDGVNLIREEWGNNVLIFLYDASGSPIGMQYRTTSYDEGKWDTYYYEKNLQGDIVAIYDASGIKLVSYTYDAWGNFTRTDVASSVPDVVKNNPLTYRGYYYDDDLDLYYLATRYYDPETCRFVTADSYVSTGQGILGHNRYAYCGNNPVMRVDPTGESWDEVWKALKKIGATILDFTVSSIAYVTGVAVSGAVDVTVTSLTGDPKTGMGAGASAFLVTNGAINNAVNGIYYTCSTREFTLNESVDFSAYADANGGFKYINRWDRLDHSREMSGDPFVTGGWEYYSEYSIHMYGWMLTGWALNKNIPLLSDIAGRSKQAWIEESLMDGNERYIILPTIVYGAFGGN